MRKFNFIMILLLIIGLTPNIYSSFGDEIVNDKPIINYNIEIISEEENNISFILDENTSFNDENSNKKFNVKEIKDLDTNINLSSLSYGVAKKDYYHFLIKYIDVNKQLEKSIDLIVKSENQKENLKKEKIVKNTNENILSFRTKQVSGFDYETDTFNTSEARNSYFEKTFNHVQNGEFEIINEVLDVTENATIIIPNEYQGRKIKLRDTGYVNYLFGTNIVKIIFENNGNKIYASADSSYLFGRNERLTEIKNLNNLDTSQVTNMTSMFQGCSVLTTLDVSGFDTSQATNMTFMFYGCSGLTTLDVSVFDTSQVTDMSYMFYGCSGLTTLDVSGFNTSQATNMTGMFYGCSGLTTLDVSGFDTSQVTDISGMFSGCRGLTKLDVSGFDTSQVTDISGMFSGCSGLTTLDVSGFNTSKVTDMSYMFYMCSKLTTLDVSGFDTSQVTNISGMFSGCGGLTKLDVSRFDISQVTNMLSMFNGCSGLTKLDVSGFDTSQVINMSSMFSKCSRLTMLDVSVFDTSQVTDMSYMFYGCSELTTLDVSRFDTSQATNISSMFSGCSRLTMLDVSGFDTSQVTNISGMFSGCGGLTKLDVSRFDTSQVTNMSIMFSGCRGLTTLDVSGFDTSQVTNMTSIFNNMSNVLIVVKDLHQFPISVNNTSNLILTFNNDNNYFKKIFYTKEEYEQINNLDNLKLYANELGQSWQNEKTSVLLKNEIKLPTEIAGKEGANYIWIYSYQISTSLGWQNEVEDSVISGNEAEDAPAINGLVIKSKNDAFNYGAKINNIGWQEVSTNQEIIDGNLETIKISLKEPYSNQYDVYYRVKTKGFGWLGWTSNGNKAGSDGYDDYIQAIQIKVINKDGEKPKGKETIPFINTQVRYKGQVQNVGWQDWLYNGAELGTVGLGLRLESMQIELTNTNMFSDANILYNSHVQNIGWEASEGDYNKYLRNGQITGTVGKGLRIEATQILLQGEISKYFDVMYRTQVENTGWLDWAENNQKSGSARYARRIETIQIKLVPKGLKEEFLNINSNPSQNKPSGVWQPFIEQQSVWYETHNAYEGWKEEQKDGNTAGSAINPIESLKINIDPANTYQGAVKYRVKETNGNWSDTQQNGKVAGTEGQGKTIEAFSVYIEEGSKLDHEFDIYYRALVDGQWLGYAKNGQVAGYEGKKITAISIMLVPKIIQYDYNEAYKDAKGEYVIINKEDIDITI